MKNKIVKFFSLIFILLISFFVKYDNKSKISDVFLNNIDALAKDEGGSSNYWCCGNTNDCAAGPNYVIKGKLSTSPCAQ